MDGERKCTWKGRRRVWDIVSFKSQTKEEKFLWNLKQESFHSIIHSFYPFTFKPILHSLSHTIPQSFITRENKGRSTEFKSFSQTYLSYPLSSNSTGLGLS